MQTLVEKERLSLSISSGSGSDNTRKYSGGELIQVCVWATTSTNIFDLAIVDEDGDTIYEELAIEGEFEEHAIYIPLRGTYTVSITNATVDEIIIVKLMIE